MSQPISPYINIVTVNETGWILRRIADSFARYLPSVAVGTAIDPNADINFYVNYPLYKKRTKCDVGWFTHREFLQPAASEFDRIANEVDWCIAHSRKTAAHLPAHKTSIVYIPPDPQFHKEELVLGVVGREYSSGRKRFHWIPELEKIPGVKIVLTNGDYEFSALPDFYRSIDYLLVLSTNEGGPIPVVEALAMKKPIIAPDVGMAWEYPCLRYRDLSELQALLRKLTLQGLTWETAAANLSKIFDSILGAKRYMPQVATSSNRAA